MEWRQQSTFSCADAFNEAQRWIEDVTGKSFGSSDFRAALENGVLLCDLINQIQPGIIKKLNRHCTPIAGLDNINVFLKACGKLGLNESQLFDPGDLQDLSTRAIVRRNESGRRLKNVLITVYWLGRKAYLDDSYSGSQLNFKAFEGLLGLALAKALDEGSNAFVKDGADRECSHPGRTMSYKRENSVDSFDSSDSRAPPANSEGCGSDAEAEEVFKTETTQQLAKGYIPLTLLQRKQKEENGKVSPSFTRSKSLSDIPTSPEVSEGNGCMGKGQNTETVKRRSHSAARDSEARWQDALTKWKNHRRSTKSNLRRRSLDREHVIKKMTNGAVNDHGERENHTVQLERDQLSAQRHGPAPRSHSASPPSKFSSSFFWTQSKAPLTRSYAIEVPFSFTSTYGHHNFSPTQGNSAGTMPPSDGKIIGKESQFAPLSLNGAAVTTPLQDNAFSSQTQFQAQGLSAPVQSLTDVSQPEEVAAQSTTLVAPVFPKISESDNNVDIADAFGDFSDQKGMSQIVTHKSPCETSGDKSRYQSAPGTRTHMTRAASWSCSASLPRGFRRSEGSCRLSSVITARPFETKQSRMSTVPRRCNVNDNQSLICATEEESTHSPPASAILKRQTATSYLRGHHQGTMQAANHEEQTAFAKVNLSDTSVSLLPNSRSDFGFQPQCEASGARIKCTHSGSPAELCQLCVDDEILTVDGDLAAHMSSSLWEQKMASALQIGTLTMDIRRNEKKGGSESAISDLQVPSLTSSSSSWSWDHEGDRRRQEKWQKEQERLLKVQYEQDKQKLEAEWQKARHNAIEENLGMRNVENPPKGIHLNSLTKTKGQHGTQADLNEIDCTEGTTGFAQLSPAHRAKSLSTPALAGSYKQSKDDLRKRKGESISKAEQERQQILEEMKKRTQLLTDNSWIRQRSSSFYKEPIYIGMPLKRYESLDTFRSPHSTLTAGYPRPHSAAANYCAPSSHSAAGYNNDSRAPQRSTSTDSRPGRMVIGRRTCSVCEGHLSSGPAMVIEALSLCFHFACFQCVGCQQYLGKTETGVQVRVQNKKPYCEPCYFQLKSTYFTPV
ncbi:LIM domain only protein 7-like isoform X2 [Corythoichthys intestinalis]|uniref:LIM domain only protein 7-like isoform X2 n=1 Tax=Corythoichthys intestinalis TaxID=161448 RepID=UPI0025A525A9|nr:LIM domain only protein 7-like isoform X2 [Corythoichthys intestinalis]